MKKAVFWDRDGVLNKVLHDETGYRHSPRKFEDFVFFDHVVDVLNEVSRRGYLSIVVTNQPEVVRGLLDPAELERMHAHLRQNVPVHDIYVCLHDAEDRCACRKPEPGMLLSAASKWDIDLRSSFMVGDTGRDMEAGRRAGCRTLLLDAIYNKDAVPDIRLESLRDVLKHCL